MNRDSPARKMEVDGINATDHRPPERLTVAHREMLDEGPSPLQWFLAELEKRVKDADAKREVHTLLRSMVGQRLFLSRDVLVRAEQQRIARGLLDAGFTPTQARRELAARCGFSARTADRLMVEVLNQRAIAAAVARSGPRDA